MRTVRNWRQRGGKKGHKNNSAFRTVSGASFTQGWGCPDWPGNPPARSDHP